LNAGDTVHGDVAEGKFVRLSLKPNVAKVRAIMQLHSADERNNHLKVTGNASANVSFKQLLYADN
jgi:hypothetical protein